MFFFYICVHKKKNFFFIETLLRVIQVTLLEKVKGRYITRLVKRYVTARIKRIKSCEIYMYSPGNDRYQFN